MRRDEVYKLIDGERDYQEGKWGPSREEDASVAEYLVLLDTYMRRAKDAFTDNVGDTAALDIVRKVGALAVACMEVHDTPPRDVKVDRRFT